MLNVIQLHENTAKVTINPLPLDGIEIAEEFSLHINNGGSFSFFLEVVRRTGVLYIIHT